MVIRSIAELVADQPLLAGWPEGADEVSGCAHLVVVAPGELLVTEGEPAATCYLIRRGSVSIELHAPGVGPLRVERVGPGNVVGWSWLFPPYRWRFDARALTPVGAIAVDGTCLRERADRDPAFGYQLMHRFGAVLLDRLEAARLRLLDLYGHGDRA